MRRKAKREEFDDRISQKDFSSVIVPDKLICNDSKFERASRALITWANIDRGGNMSVETTYISWMLR